MGNQRVEKKEEEKKNNTQRWPFARLCPDANTRKKWRRRRRRRASMLNIKSPYRYIWGFLFRLFARTARRFPDSLRKRTMDLVQGSGLRIRPHPRFLISIRMLRCWFRFWPPGNKGPFPAGQSVGTTLWGRWCAKKAAVTASGFRC